MPLGTEVGLDPGDFVLDGDPAPPKRWHSPQFSAHVDIVAKRLDGSRCQLVGGRPRPRRHRVRWGRSSQKKDALPAIFGRCLLWPNGWMDQDATWYGGRPRPGTLLDGAQTPPPPQKKGMPPIFGPYLLRPNGRPSQLLLSSCFSFQRPARTALPIFTLYDSNDVAPPKSGPLGVRTMSDILWGNVPRNPPKRGVNRHFQAKLRKSKKLPYLRNHNPISPKFDDKFLAHVYMAKRLDGWRRHLVRK